MSNTNISTDTVTSRKPRRVYPYKGKNLVCFAGQRYTAPEGSAIQAEHPVTKIEAPEGDAPATIEVTQRLKGKKGVTETWSMMKH